MIEEPAELVVHENGEIEIGTMVLGNMYWRTEVILSKKQSEQIKLDIVFQDWRREQGLPEL